MSERPGLPACKIHEHGFVHLQHVLPERESADLQIVRAARTSFRVEEVEMDDRARGLIGFLMRNGHGTPFEHVVFEFLVRAPIFANREWFRHRIASYNEESGRYKQYAPEFYLPDREHMRTQVGKPGAYTFEDPGDIVAELARREMVTAFEESLLHYERLLGMGIAKELARIVLPVAQYSTFMWTVNLRSLLNFLALRNAEPAMREIHEYAEVIEGMVREIVPVAMAAFDDGGRRAP